MRNRDSKRPTHPVPTLPFFLGPMPAPQDCNAVEIQTRAISQFEVAIAPTETNPPTIISLKAVSSTPMNYVAADRQIGANVGNLTLDTRMT